MKQLASKFPTLTRRTLPALALCLTPLIALPANAADGESAKQAVPATNFRTTTIDKDTNRLRAPEADEPLSAAAQSSTSRSVQSQSMLRSPNALRFQAQTIYGRDGSETQRLDMGRALRFSVVHRHADGSLHKDCVVGDEGVHAHLNSSNSATAVTRKQGANHE